MGLFGALSRPEKADSAGAEKRDSTPLPGPSAPRDTAVLDVENLAGGADLGKRRGVGAGHPDLGAEPRQFAEQRGAPTGIEMRDHLVEQQQRGDAGHFGDQTGMRQDQANQQRL